jgi:hypothetical protein
MLLRKNPHTRVDIEIGDCFSQLCEMMIFTGDLCLQIFEDKKFLFGEFIFGSKKFYLKLI